jgi:hypothetical protein
MTLAIASKEGFPYARIVLLKEYEAGTINESRGGMDEDYTSPLDRNRNTAHILIELESNP